MSIYHRYLLKQHDETDMDRDEVVSLYPDLIIGCEVREMKAVYQTVHRRIMFFLASMLFALTLLTGCANQPMSDSLSRQDTFITDENTVIGEGREVNEAIIYFCCRSADDWFACRM